jgi:hypothetical protein
MRNTADVTGGKPIAVFLQSISGVHDVAFTHLLQHLWKKGTVASLLFSPGHHTGMENGNFCLALIYSHVYDL